MNSASAPSAILCIARSSPFHEREVRCARPVHRCPRRRAGRAIVAPRNRPPNRRQIPRQRTHSTFFLKRLGEGRGFLTAPDLLSMVRAASKGGGEKAGVPW